ncbi:MAG TPA: outer membrane beta-barrel protein [Candidatus Limnocylindria bacterium]|nr:outer membrane beta-barrel protein [Candidatus Limnocylindria bacterium]
MISGGGVGALNATDFDDDVRDRLGVEGRGGYRFHEHLAVEAQVTYLHDNGDDLEAGSLDCETLSGTANLKIYMLTGRVQPYAVGGVGGSWVHLMSDVDGARCAVSLLDGRGTRAAAGDVSCRPVARRRSPCRSAASS